MIEVTKMKKIFLILSLFFISSCQQQSISISSTSYPEPVGTFDLIIEDSNHYCLNFPNQSRQVPGTEITLSISPQEDNIAMFINSEYYSIQNEKWEYTFLMPALSITISFSEIHMENKTFLDFYPKLANLKKEDILEIAYVQYRGSIAPGILQDVYLLEDYDLIWQYLQESSFTLAPREEQKSGIGYPYLNILIDKDEYQIAISPSYFSSGMFFKNQNIFPQIDTTKTYFNILNYSSGGKIYLHDVYQKDVNLNLQNIFFEKDSENYEISGLQYRSDVCVEIIDARHFRYENQNYKIVGLIDFSDVF